MGYDTYCCVLCGNIIGEYTETWLDEFRADSNPVYTKDKQWDSARLSGVGMRISSSDADFPVPLDADQRHDDIGLRRSALMSLWPFKREECTISSKYYKKRCYPQYSKEVHIEHSDPLHIYGLQEIFQQRLEEQGEFSKNNDVDKVAWTNRAFSKTSNSTDCFQLLPTKIVHSILILLPSKDVLNAKLASATFAALPLTRAFWPSRFQRGLEFHCVFEVQGLQTKDHDWEAIYMDATSLQDSPNFQNRRRIWKLLLLLEELHDRMDSVELQGNPSQSVFEPDAPEDKRLWNLASGVLHEPDDWFSDGCRSLFARTIDITSKVIAVFVTFARFNGIDYIGYVVSDEEINMDADGSFFSNDSCAISGFNLAIDSKGVRALSLLMSSGKVSAWVGKHEGIPKSRVFLNKGDILSLKAGFDIHTSFGRTATFPQEHVDYYQDESPLQPVETGGSTITGFYATL
ncbi:hypothetical protein V492_06821, partial [Pseudogymnoascus sp. VKM F-4246]